jgi:hypothetical protein
MPVDRELVKSLETAVDTAQKEVTDCHDEVARLKREDHDSRFGSGGYDRDRPGPVLPDCKDAETRLDELKKRLERARAGGTDETDRVWETGFEQIGEREIDRDATPWRVIDTYRVWLKYKGRVYDERVFSEHDWAGPEDAETGGESAPATNPEDLYDLVRSAINRLKDRATTFRVPGEEVPPFDGEDPPPYRPLPKGDGDQ